LSKIGADVLIIEAGGADAQNLQDHVLVSGVVYQYKGKMPDRPVDSNAV
jgi:hypothetical protein